MLGNVLTSPTPQAILTWATLAVALPCALGALAGLPFWLKGRATLGNTLASGTVIVVIVLLIIQQFGAYLSAQVNCPGPACPSDTATAFGFLILAGLGWLDAWLLLALGGVLEDRRKHKLFDRSRL
ncbi:MAG: hypothetical protein RMN25_06990 [Anaerolineae bacterium]|nr:hypothetical protein [Thermoflexales bacterium]MDW8407515.1 hypothetical protein [Anaerolineae bacterium]